MDTIKTTIDRTDVGQDEPVDLVNILINGRNLIDFIRAVELTFDQCKQYPPLAGSYIGIQADSFSDCYLRGLDGSGKKALLLQCGGFDDFGCWPLLAKVTVENNTVIWSDFEQPHRGPSSPGGHWVYNLKFVFDRKQYETELSRCGITFEK
jgi:hypothetical protein